MAQKADLLLPIFVGQPVIPVIRIERVENAVPLARALAKGGLPAIEITLRTAVAIEAIRRVASEVEEAVTGAGTILNARGYEEAVAAGARFIVSPGVTRPLLDAAEASPVPFLPGAVTAGEIMSAMDEGYSILKFFPAEQAGGAPYLKSLASPLSGVKFCPTGGVSAKNAADYLGLPNVVCVGGSWIAPDDLIAQGRWDEIEALARAAAQLRRG